MELIAQHEEALQDTKALLLATQDMGDTEGLMAAVEGDAGLNPIQLRNALLLRSPLLSDTVMVRSAHNDVPLPNAMLAQVLATNPQAAKSDRVLEALGNRANPMPPYFMNAILEAGASLSPIDGLKAQIAHHQAERDIAAGMLLARFASTPENSGLGKRYDSIAMLRDYHPDRTYRYIKAFALFEQKQTEEALAELTAMDDGTLSSPEIEELEGVIALTHLMAGMEANGITLGALDSLSRTTIENIAANGQGLARLFASNMLTVADTIPFLAPEIDLDGGPNHAAGQPEGSVSLFVEPYPVTSYLVVGYDLGSQSCHAPKLEVEHERGTVVYREQLTYRPEVSGWEVAIEVEGWQPGLYTVKLMDGGTVLARRVFAIDGEEQPDAQPETPDGLLPCPIVTVHPNPTNGQVVIEVAGCAKSVPFTYEVFSREGVRQLSGSATDRKSLSLAGLSPGTYLVVVRAEGKYQTFSVVLRK